MQILPHRQDMLLLDSVCSSNGTAEGFYTVRGDEYFLRGHFPGNAIVPGVILCEILAQSACVLLKDCLQEGEIPMYTGLNNVKFRMPAKPGDTLHTSCRITRAKPPFYFAKGQMRIGERVCMSAEFSFAITGEALCSQKY